MELVYFWVDKFRNINKQGLNFSPTHHFEYDYISQKLSYSFENANLIENFFGKQVLNFSCIVGENGSGKTNFLRLLTYNDLKLTSYILIFVNEKKELVTFCNRIDIINREELRGDNFAFQSQEFISYLYDTTDNSPKPHIIYTSNVFYPEFNLLSKLTDTSWHITDVSISRLLTYSPIFSEYPISTFRFDELLRLNDTITFIDEKLSNTNSEQNRIKEQFGFHNTSGLKSIQIKPAMFAFNKREADVKILKDLFIAFNYDTNLIQENSFILIFIRLVTHKINKRLKKETKRLSEAKEELKILSEKYKSFDTDEILKDNSVSKEYEYISRKLENLQGEQNNYDSIKSIESLVVFFNEKLKELTELFKFQSHECVKDPSIKYSIKENLKEKENNLFGNFISYLLEFISNIEYEDYNFTLQIPRNEFNNFLEKYSLFLEKYFFLDSRVTKEKFTIDILDFDWGLSSGQLAIFNMISKLIYSTHSQFVQNHQEKISSHVILIDEADLYLHPEWSRNNVMLLTTLLPLIFKKPIQIILTTHSPFVLSDLPKNNVIYLKRYKSEDIEVISEIQQIGNCKVLNNNEKNELTNTFGCNIHTLLNDAFFMQNGVLGEFAKAKINDLINYLKNKESKIKNEVDAQLLINLIGEPIIRNQTQKMLDEIINEKLKQENVRLQEELNKLKSKLG